MNELTMVLDELVADAPVEKASWPDVLARSRKSRRPRRVSKRLVLALAVITLLALAGTAVGVGVSLLTQPGAFPRRGFRMTQSGSARSQRSPPVTTGPSLDGEARSEPASTSQSRATPPSDAASPSAVRNRQRMRPAAVSPPMQSRGSLAEAISLVAMARRLSSASLHTRSPPSRSSFATAESSMHPCTTPRRHWKPRFDSSSLVYPLVS